MPVWLPNVSVALSANSNWSWLASNNIFVAPPLPLKSTSSLNVDIPDTFNLLTLNWLVETPAVPVIVTAPPEIAETSKLVPKLIVPAVPTVEPSCLITIPEPDAVMPVSPEPSPTKEVAVIIPALPRWILLPTLIKSSISAFGEDRFPLESIVKLPVIFWLPDNVSVDEPLL